MKKVMCKNRHYFDVEKFGICPVCGEAEFVEEIKDMDPPSPGKSLWPPKLHKRTPPSEPSDTPKPVAPPESGDTPEQVDPPIPVDPLVPVEPPTPVDPPKEKVPQNGKGEKEGLPPTRGLFEQPMKPEEVPSPPVETPPIHKKDHPRGPEIAKPATGNLATAVHATGSKNMSALPKTQAFYDFEVGEPPVGWLVCTKGVYQGTAFECKTGRNKIGRSADMGIVLTDDTSISRDTHAYIIYEPNKREFFIQTGTSDGLVYLNGNLLFSNEKIHAYDKIVMGKAEFVFLPLCGEQFSWDDYMAKE